MERRPIMSPQLFFTVYIYLEAAMYKLRKGFVCTALKTIFARFVFVARPWRILMVW